MALHKVELYDILLRDMNNLKLVPIKDHMETKLIVSKSCLMHFQEQY